LININIVAVGKSPGQKLGINKRTYSDLLLYPDTFQATNSLGQD